MLSERPGRPELLFEIARDQPAVVNLVHASVQKRKYGRNEQQHFNRNEYPLVLMKEYADQRHHDGGRSSKKRSDIRGSVVIAQAARDHVDRHPLSADGTIQMRADRTEGIALISLRDSGLLHPGRDIVA